MAEAGDLGEAGGSETGPQHHRGQGERGSDLPEPRADSERVQLKRFFSNPMVGFVGSIASVIGLGLAVFFYFQGRATRELRYLVNPARTVVVHTGQTSRLSITLDGAPVNRDVTSAQIAFWNEGHGSIKAENMLQPLIIRTSATTPIIDAVIRKVHRRKIVSVELDRRRMANGELAIRWNILEFRDGGVIQITYLGGVGTPITAATTIEGQGDPTQAKFANEPFSLAKFGLELLLVIVANGLLTSAVRFRVERSKSLRTYRAARQAFQLIYFLSFTAVVLLLFDFVSPLFSSNGPPFGF